MSGAVFQSFDAPSRPEQGPPRLAALRAAMAERGLDALLVPRSDAHQGEYVAPCDERLAWLTGFTGSAGFAAVTATEAGVFVDGRYRVQVRAQVDAAAFAPVDWPATRLADWLKPRIGEGARIGYDPWLHTVEEIRKLGAALEGKSAVLVPTTHPIDALWTDRPGRPARPIRVQPDALAGKSHAEKRADLAAALGKAGAAGAVLTLPDSICWLLNIRGSDIAHNPVVQAFAFLHATGEVDLFTDATADDAALDHLGAAVRLHRYDSLPAHLATLAPGRIRLDPKTAPEAVRAHLETLAGHGVAIEEAEDPCILPKARKSRAEIAATREAHLRDGAAMVEFLAWFHEAAPRGGLTEIDVVERLEGFRRATGALEEISFDTICGAGPHGAVVHYRVTRETDRSIAPGDLVLVDSGGQYLDGTTDITRTLATGTPTDDQRHAFTRVLQGMIAISRIRWPKGLAGRDLDALARAPLWMAGQDYDHGTGHGVGVFLSVHEGPQRISRLSEVPLEPGMILSNEPGYYRDGHWGIRIENLVVVQAAPELGDGRDQLAFETLTFVPIDTRLVAPGMLSTGEREWLNAYHAEVLDKIGPRVSPAALDWLRAATTAI